MERKIASIEKPEEGAASSSEPTDKEPLISPLKARISELRDLIQKFEAEKDGFQRELETYLEAAKTHLAYVQEQKTIAQFGGPGAFVETLTTLDGIKVELTEEKKLERFPGAIIRTFKLTKDGEPDSRTVTQIDYPDWEDFGASSANTLASLRSVYQEEHGDNPTSMNVHCRAGVGRTGTFVAYCGAMDAIERAVEEETISELNAKEMLFDLISDIRSQRDLQMVQSNSQGEQLVTALQLEVLKLAQKEDQKL